MCRHNDVRIQRQFDVGFGLDMQVSMTMSMTSDSNVSLQSISELNSTSIRLMIAFNVGLS